jgi:lactoylglutathione lyase
MKLVHTCVRVRDIDASLRFYEALGFERRGKLQFQTAGDGYNHIAITVDDIHATVAKLAEQGIEPEKPPYHPGGREEVGTIAFVQDPDGYRIELIDGPTWPTPQDPSRSPRGADR